MKTMPINEQQVMDRADELYRGLSGKNIPSRSMRCLCVALVEAFEKRIQEVEARADNLRTIGSNEP